MTEEITVKQQDALDTADQLALMLISGDISEREKGLALRKLQIGLGSQTVAKLSYLCAQNKPIEKLAAKATAMYAEKLEAELDADIFTTSQLGEISAMLNSQVAGVAGILSKVAQGKSLFPEDTLSEDDRKVIRIMGAIQTQEDKERFMKLVDEFQRKENSFEQVEVDEVPAKIKPRSKKETKPAEPIIVEDTFYDVDEPTESEPEKVSPVKVDETVVYNNEETLSTEGYPSVDDILENPTIPTYPSDLPEMELPGDSEPQVMAPDSDDLLP